jgi:transcriptional regulator GlxA family with amidase domain
MLRVEGKYLPGQQEDDGTRPVENDGHEPESGDEQRPRGEAVEGADEGTLEASLDPRIGRVLDAIEGNPFVTMGDLSRLVNLSQSRLSHLFKAALSVSLNSYLSNRRVERAAELLRSTEMQVKEITYDTGYKQVPSFVRAFQRRFGASPGRYRRSG